MALMRHYGAPTRLLDLTRSPYVAAFFAVAETKGDEESAIWAIDIDAIRAEAIHLLSESGVIENPTGSDFSFSDPDVFNRVFLQETNPFIVAPVQPMRMNDRVTSQQGLFLCPNTPPPSTAVWGYEFALKQVLKSDRDTIEARWRDKHPEEKMYVLQRLCKLYIAPQARGEILRELHRMNINYATLFPGLDGFAKSLATNVTISFPWLSYDRFDPGV